MRVAISSDHAGFHLKQFILQRLSSEPGLVFKDLGTYAEDPAVDYSDYAEKVAEAVVQGAYDRGIVVCGSGAGVSMAANKVPGTHAFSAGDVYTAHQAVEHDAANVLCLGERVTGPEYAVEIAHAFLKAQFSHVERHERRVMKVDSIESRHSFPLEALKAEGQSIWLDNISRSMITSGELRKLAWDEHVVGMTSNPTIFEKAMGHGQEYAQPAEKLARQGLSTEDIYWALAIEDIQMAADVMRAVYELSAGQDGYISLEVAPSIANDTGGSVRMARDLFYRLGRDNVMIKIPATAEGVPAVEESIASGINVNVTLMFAVELYEKVANAYIRGLERFYAGDASDHLARPTSLVPAPVSVASFFVSRVDTLVDKLLADKIATASAADRLHLEGLLGRAAVANARLAYQSFQRIFSGPRWDALAARGAHPQRPLWASTSTKNPRYRDVLYVEELIGPDTVNTLPPATLEAFHDHGRVHRTIDGEARIYDAHQVMQGLAEVGIDMASVTRQLELEGVKSFSDSFDQLLQTLEQRRRVLVGAR